VKGRKELRAPEDYGTELLLSMVIQSLQGLGGSGI
jgi:hypothetical protein